MKSYFLFQNISVVRCKEAKLFFVYQQVNCYIGRVPVAFLSLKKIEKGVERETRVSEKIHHSMPSNAIGV